MPFEEFLTKMEQTIIGVEVTHDEAFSMLCKELAARGIVVWDGTTDIEKYTTYESNAEYNVMSFSVHHPGEKKLDFWQKSGWINWGKELIKADQIKFASDVALDEFKSLIGE